MACPQAHDSIGKEAECEEIVITIPPELPRINIPSDLPPAEWPECCIYRVPKQLRKVNEEAYTPKLVSIGPFHHSRKELRDMEMHKLRYLNDFLERTGKRQEDLLKIIKDKEEKIRHCYSEDPLKINHCYSEDDWRLESNDFVQMILLDAIFIIELFLKVNSREKDYILSKPWLVNGIYYDLILLENQLPFFVLEELLTFAFNDQQIKEHQGDLKKEDALFLKLSRCFFFQYDIDKKQESTIGWEVKHFTDLLRYFFCSPKLKPTGNQYNIYSATKLDEAGMQFKAFNKDERRLLDITFPENMWLKYCPCFNLSWLVSRLPCLKCFQVLEGMEPFLEVPAFEIGNHTECLFRNLMALEQCYYPRNAYICNYVWLMDNLINTEEDVALLVDKKVIINQLGSNASVAALIKNLGNEIVLSGSCYSSLAIELNAYYDHPWNRLLVALKSTYFSDFGRVNATVATLLALVGLFLPILTNNGCKCN